MYAFREVVNFLSFQKKVVLITPFGDTPAGKFVQSHIARRYFDVPQSKFLSRFPELFEPGRISVAKSLSSERVGKGAVLYTTRVQESDLNPGEPWMIQDLVEAEMDITIACVRDELFSFQLSRSKFLARTVDWREVAAETLTDDWPVHPLPEEFKQRVFKFMNDMGLHYGRIDFLYENGKYQFLEVNSNGEWGWLDADSQNGLFDKIIFEISPHTEVHPAPFPRVLNC